MGYRTINGVRTLPLNGWRTRRLAETLHIDEDTLETVGFITSCPARKIQELPEFDGENQAYADSFPSEDIVTIKVEAVDPSYGVHISINGGAVPKVKVSEEPKQEVFNTNETAYPVCPRCGAEHEEPDRDMNLNLDGMEDSYMCVNCGLEVDVQVHIERTFTTTVAEGVGDYE